MILTVLGQIVFYLKWLLGFKVNDPNDDCLDDSMPLQQLINQCQQTSGHELLYHELSKTAYKLEILVEKIRKASPQYDLPNAIRPANGYRSFVGIVDDAAKMANSQITKTNSDILEQLINLFKSLTTCASYLAELMDRSDVDSLYPPCEAIDSRAYAKEILQLTRNVELECFYGRFIANQFDKRMRFILKCISQIMVCYSQLYYEPFGIRMLRGLFNYLKSDKERGAKHVMIAQHASIDFIQSFWAYSESPFMMWPMRICNPIAVSRSITIDKHSVTINGKEIKPHNEKYHLVTGRLISKTVRKGMKNVKRPTAERSNGLVLHVHGGGFVSQSAESQEIFLRKWASSLDVPLFSLDYSLAPNCAFPHAVHQIFYSYCVAISWAHEYLGSTADRIILAGDSAGGNIILGAMQLCIERRIRLPDGLLLAYVPLLVSLVPSPSRLLSLMDPLLPYGLMMRCAKAYIFGDGSGGDLECLLDMTLPLDPLVSPYICSDEILRKLPRISLCTSTLDPCLDDAIMFTKKLKKLGNEIELDIVEGLPHGFLNLCWVNDKAKQGVQICSNRISTMLKNAN